MVSTTSLVERHGVGTRIESVQCAVLISREVDKVQKKLDHARELLGRYGFHLLSCPARTSAGTCKCGWADVRREQRL